MTEIILTGHSFDTEKEEQKVLDAIAEVHEVECEECGSDKEVSNGLCKRCRCCDSCGVEFEPGEKKFSGTDGPICSGCHDDMQSDAICGSCNGSGEGMWDGSSCRVCRGSGSAPHDNDY